MTTKEKSRRELGEIQETGSRAEFQASLQRFTTMMLDRLAIALTEKDRDEKEIKMLSAILTKAYRFWDNALPSTAHEEHYVVAPNRLDQDRKRPTKNPGKEGVDEARQIPE